MSTPSDKTDFPGSEAFDKAPSRFRLEDFNTVTAGRVFWRVKRLWPRVGVAFAGGPTGVAKTFWLLDACARVCRGEPVLGRPSIPAGVVYVGAEDSAGVRLRIEGLRLERGCLGEHQFQFIGAAPDLTNPVDVDDLKAALVEARDLMAAHGIPLGLVVIDTMSAATPGADENTAKDMGPVLNALQDMARELETLIVVVAHTGKDESRGLRGWSGLMANADGIIMLEDPEGSEVRRGKVVKVKNGRAGDRFAFTLKVVVLGEDEDGDSIDTCVIEDTDLPEPTKGGARGGKAADNGELVVRALHLCLDEYAVDVYAPGADRAKGVEVSRLRQKAYTIGVGPTEPDPAVDGDLEEERRLKRKWQGQRKADFDRGLQHELKTKRLRKHGNVVWETYAKT